MELGALSKVHTVTEGLVQEQGASLAYSMKDEERLSTGALNLTPSRCSGPTEILVPQQSCPSGCRVTMKCKPAALTLDSFSS